MPIGGLKAGGLLTGAETGYLLELVCGPPHGIIAGRGLYSGTLDTSGRRSRWDTSAIALWTTCLTEA